MEGREEAGKTLRWEVGGCVGVEKPLEHRDASLSQHLPDHVVGRAMHLMAPSNVPGRKPNPCPISCKNRSPSTSLSSATSAQSVLLKETASGGHTKHARRDVHPYPDMSLFIQDLPAQSTPTAYIEDESGWHGKG